MKLLLYVRLDIKYLSGNGLDPLATAFWLMLFLAIWNYKGFLLLRGSTLRLYSIVSQGTCILPLFRARGLLYSAIL